MVKLSIQNFMIYVTILTYTKDVLNFRKNLIIYKKSPDKGERWGNYYE